MPLSATVLDEIKQSERSLSRTLLAVDEVLARSYETLAESAETRARADAILARRYLSRY
jgi:hypothetical protein